MSDEMNNSATETQDISDEQRFYNLLDSQETTTDEANGAEETEEAVEEVDEEVDDSEEESEEVVTEEESEEEPSAEAEEEYIFSVQIDGEEQEVNHNELIQGYQRQSDYTRKTQSLAEERKAFEAEKAKIAEERNQLVAMLQQQQSNNPALDKFKDVNWQELKEYEPEKYLMLREEQREAERSQQESQAELQRQTQAQQQEYQAQLQRFLAEEDAKLVDRIDGWGDPESKKEIQQSIAKYAKDIGYSDEELGNLVDSRALELMHKARLYDEMQSTSKKVVSKKKAKAVRKVVKGGQKVTKAQSESKRIANLRNRAKSTGSVDDAADLFFEMI